MNEREQVEMLASHWAQVRRDARKQLEMARLQYKKCQAKLAELALEDEVTRPLE